ncbi:hypothetical protein GQ53DRAFT_755300, partial [Thozetella sp. PMI_491]
MCYLDIGLVKVSIFVPVLTVPVPAILSGLFCRMSALYEIGKANSLLGLRLDSGLKVGEREFKSV